MGASKIVTKDNVAAILEQALDAGGGLLRLTPTWVPRSFLHPGKRIKLRRATGTRWAPIAAASTSAGSPAPRKPPTTAGRPTKG